MSRSRNHGAMGSRYPIEVTDEHGRVTIAALICPEKPTRRRSPDLSAYDRLDPPQPRRYGKSRVDAHIEGMDRLRAALDEMAAKVNAASADALRFSAEAAMRDARGAPKAKAEPGQSYSMAGVKIVVDEAVGPDRAVMGYRWPDGSIRPHAHKRSDTFW